MESMDEVFPSHKRGRRRTNKMAVLKQLWPRTLWTTYRDHDGRWLCLWRQWMGRAYDITRVPIGENPTHSLHG